MCNHNLNCIIMDKINLDKRFGPQRSLLRQLLLLFLFAATINPTLCFGFDSANSCSPNGKLSRRGRAQMLAAIPCDLTRQAYCNLPGSAYPWHAVRRFVHENQGLMKRMYGDVRHISILRDEIQNNEIDIDDVEEASERYSRDGGHRRSAKYTHNTDYANSKNNEVLMEPHFRPVTTTTSSTIHSTIATSPATVKAATKIPNNEEVSSTTVPTRTTKSNLVRNKPSTTLEPIDKIKVINTTKSDSNKDATLNAENGKSADGDSDSLRTENVEESKEEDEDENLAFNSIYENPSVSPQVDAFSGDNIEIVNSPQFGSLQNLTKVAATISTTLKVVTTTTTTKNTNTNTNDEKIATSSGNNGARKPTTYQQQQQQQQQQSNQQNHQQKQQQQPQKATLTKLKESSTIKPNESERGGVPITPSPVKGTTTAATSLLKSHNNNGNNMNNNNKKTDYSYAPTEPTTAASLSSSPALLSPSSSSSKLSSSSSSFLSSSPSKSSIDLLSGEKLRKPTNSPATASAVSTTKPVLRDGQLFQDTLKQETPPMVNARGVNACPVKEEVVAPFWANNTRGEVLALLNLYPFEQYVHWEKCTHEHKQMYCREGCRCEQQYRLHRLLAYDPHNECRGIFSDWFRFPSCCICKCYDIPMDFRATSRSPRSERKADYTHPIDNAEEVVQRAIYDHATEEWYRPKEEHINTFEG